MTTQHVGAPLSVNEAEHAGAPLGSTTKHSGMPAALLPLCGMPCMLLAPDCVQPSCQLVEQTGHKLQACLHGATCGVALLCTLRVRAGMYVRLKTHWNKATRADVCAERHAEFGTALDPVAGGVGTHTGAAGEPTTLLGRAQVQRLGMQVVARCMQCYVCRRPVSCTLKSIAQDRMGYAILLSKAVSFKGVVRSGMLWAPATLGGARCSDLRHLSSS